MTDRDLLERAAKAAGYDVRWHETWQCFVHEGSFNIHNPPTLGGQRMEWEPFYDDGDALRLAAKLRFEMKIEAYGTSVRAAGGRWYGCEAHMHGGIESATRRAIVRAAAGEPVAAALTAHPMVNQCDGCMRGLPVIGGLHRPDDGWPFRCTADRYLDAV